MKLSRKQSQHVKDNFSRKQMSKLFVEMVDKGLQGKPTQVNLKLPKMPKLNNVAAKTPTLKLPKLNKV